MVSGLASILGLVLLAWSLGLWSRRLPPGSVRSIAAPVAMAGMASPQPSAVPNPSDGHAGQVLVGQVPIGQVPAGEIPELPVAGDVLAGVDVLLAQGCAPLRGKRVGLVTNQTGITRDGRSTIEALANAPGVRLVALFAPEHGVRGNLAASQRVPGGRDERTGLPVYSLYGGTTKPSTRMLRGVDVLVFDLQDIGSRSYTYVSTMGKCMEACAQQRIPFMVLDRPNLIGGQRVEGNILDVRFRSFIGAYPVSYCHGLTVGEIAGMINRNGWLAKRARCALTVIKMEGYRRAMLPEQTGLPWVATSPNIPWPDSPFFYAATGIAGELGTLSVGIGTPFPFQMAGAPGIDGAALTRELERRRLRGFFFQPFEWVPQHGVYAGQRCRGTRIYLSDPGTAELTRLNFELLDALRRVAPRRALFGVSRAKDQMFDLACGTNRVRRLFRAGQSAAQIWADWNRGSAQFRAQRQAYLLYS
jgi:uncharacterized protein YbbC (DUF1343 family)